MAEPPADVVVADPRDGAIIAPSDLATATDYLCDLVLELKRRERHLIAMRQVIERELARRLHEQDRVAVPDVGGYSLRVDTDRARRWDADELEGAVRQLVHDGILTAGETADLFQTERKVNAKNAQRLLGQLTGSAYGAVADCFQWRPKGKPRVVVERTDQRQLRP